MFWFTSALAAAGLLLASAPASAQAIERWVPAHSSTWGYANEKGRSQMVVGVPGERSVIRLKPRPPYDGGWKLTLLEPGQPLREWTGAPHEKLTTDEIVFGEGGAVAVVVQHLGPGGGSYLLRADSQVPAAALLPQVQQLEVDGHWGQGFTTALRPGLELRVKLRWSEPAGCFPIVPPDYAAHLELVPPYGAGLPSTLVLAAPDLTGSGACNPATWKQEYEAKELTHVNYAIDLGADSIRPRLHRERKLFNKPWKPKPSKGPSATCQAPQPSPQPVELDALAVEPGGTVTLSSAFCKPGCANVGDMDVASAWLASPHADGAEPLAGVKLGDGMSFAWRDWGANVEGELVVPAETKPGLYLIQLRPGAPEACKDWTTKIATEVPLLVLEP